MKKGFGLVGILIIIGIIAVGSGGYYYLSSESNTKIDDIPEEYISDVNDNVVEEEPHRITQDETTNWKTYRNGEYEFEFKYPKNWEITSEKNGQYCSSPEFRLYISPSSDKKTFLGIIYTPTQGGERLNPENICLSEQEKEQLHSKEVVFLNNIKMYKKKKTVTLKEVKINNLY